MKSFLDLACRDGQMFVLDDGPKYQAVGLFRQANTIRVPRKLSIHLLTADDVAKKAKTLFVSQ